MTRTSTSGCGCGETAAQLSSVDDRDQRRVLMIVLAINVALFVGEFGAGWWAESTALQADSLDSLGDAGVYALSLFVVGRSLQWRAGTAIVKGVIQGLFGITVLVEVVRKAVVGVVPDAPVMAVVAAIAFVANLTCFVLLTRFRHQDINLRSVWLCSRNDALGNLAVMGAAAGVWATAHGWPDIAVALVLAGLALTSGAPSKRWLLYTALSFQSRDSAAEVTTPLPSIVSDRSSASAVVNQPGMPEASFSSWVTAATHARSGAFPRLSGS